MNNRILGRYVRRFWQTSREAQFALYTSRVYTSKDTHAPKADAGSLTASPGGGYAAGTTLRITQLLLPLGRSYSKPSFSNMLRVPSYRNEDDTFFPAVLCG
jgi:hypothetical protein